MANNWSSRSRAVRGLSVAGIICLLSACGRDGPTEAGPLAHPAAPSLLVNPLCSTYNTLHQSDTITTPVTWTLSGSPHRVTGTVTIEPAGRLTIEEGAIVCFLPGAGLHSTGGRLVSRGLATAPVVLTAYDPAQGWNGVNLEGSPSVTSYITHSRVEYVALNYTAIASDDHRLQIDSTVVRQSGAGVRLDRGPSRFTWSRVDTTTNRFAAALTLGDSSRAEHLTITGAAGVGLLIEGSARINVLGGRIEGSGGTGIVAPHETGIVFANPVRVVGGLSYPIETTPALLQRLYSSVAATQDSLKGNARDTVIMLGGTLEAPLYVRAGLPWHVKAQLVVGDGGVLHGEPGSRLVMDEDVDILAVADGRLRLRGSQTDPVVLTADDPARGWGGIDLFSVPAQRSYITNARVEHVEFGQVAVDDGGSHPVRIDSVVLRQTGAAVRLWSAGSRLTFSRVDTTLTSYLPAVELAADAVLESTLIRASSNAGVAIHSDTVQVESCEVRGSVLYGIVLYATAPVHNCNLVDNGTGLYKTGIDTADATGNWWGDAGGPTAPGANGVTGPVTYTPWRTTPYVLPYVP
ncbi:MAG TPA: hypothetical protein VEQ60_15245 [Longimicrobium sp.]|nr:hypothetical protein [Longimicrobium sp.]